jgi:hypothetical protein
VSEDSSSEEDRHKKKKRRKHKRMSKEDWEAGLELCPLEDRPMYLRSRHGTAGRMSLTNLLKTGEFSLCIQKFRLCLSKFALITQLEFFLDKMKYKANE